LDSKIPFGAHGPAHHARVQPVCSSGSCLTRWLRLVCDRLRTRLRLLCDSGFGSCGVDPVAPTTSTRGTATPSARHAGGDSRRPDDDGLPGTARTVKMTEHTDPTCWLIKRRSVSLSRTRVRVWAPVGLVSVRGVAVSDPSGPHFQREAGKFRRIDGTRGAPGGGLVPVKAAWTDQLRSSDLIACRCQRGDCPDWRVETSERPLGAVC
jgi:hypothetical protein